MKKIVNTILILLLYLSIVDNFCIAVDGVPTLDGGNKLNIQDNYGGQQLDPTITQNAGASAGNLVAGIVAVINFILFFVGLIAFIFILYAGFKYLTAGSDEGAHKKALTIIKNAAIGIIIIVLSYAIVNLLVVSLPKGEIDPSGTISSTTTTSSTTSSSSSSSSSSPTSTNVVSTNYSAKILKGATGSYLYEKSPGDKPYNLPKKVDMKLMDVNGKEISKFEKNKDYDIKLMLQPNGGNFADTITATLDTDIWGIDNNTYNGTISNGILSFKGVKFNNSQKYRMKGTIKDGDYFEAVQFIDVDIREANENVDYVKFAYSIPDENTAPNVFEFKAVCNSISADCNKVQKHYTWKVFSGNDLLGSSSYEYLDNTRETSVSPTIKFKESGEYEMTLQYYEDEENGIKTRAGTSSLIFKVESTMNMDELLQMNLPINIHSFRGYNDISYMSDLFFHNAYADDSGSGVDLSINMTLKAIQEGGAKNYKYFIDFGDGKNITFVGTDSPYITYDDTTKKMSISHEYQKSGEYKIKLQITQLNNNKNISVSKTIFLNDGNSVKSYIYTKYKSKNILSKHVGSGSDIDGASFSIYSDENITFDGIKSVGLKGVNQNLSYSWVVEENGVETYNTQGTSINYKFKYVNASKCIFPNNIDGCAKVKLVVFDKDDGSKMDEMIVYVRVSKELINFVINTDKKVYISPQTVRLNLSIENNKNVKISNYQWSVEKKVDNNDAEIYVMQYTSAPTASMNISYNMGRDIDDSNINESWCKELNTSARIVDIYMKAVDFDGYIYNTKANVCILPNMEEPIITVNMPDKVDKSKDIVMSGYATVKGGQSYYKLYKVISSMSVVKSDMDAGYSVGVGEWKIVKSTSLPEYNDPMWNVDTYKCSNIENTADNVQYRYPDNCTLSGANLSGTFYVMFKVTNVSVDKKAVGPQFYGYKISKLDLSSSTALNDNSNMKALFTVNGSLNLSSNNQSVELFDHLASVKSIDDKVEISIKYEFSDYYKIYKGNDFLTKSVGGGSDYIPLYITKADDPMCSIVKLKDKIKVDSDTNIKKICLLDGGSYSIKLTITSGDKLSSDIKIINVSKDKGQIIPVAGGIITYPVARLKIKENNNVYEGSDNNIHLKGSDQITVIFDFKDSTGTNLKYYFDSDISYDTDKDGISSNDVDNISTNDLEFSATYKKIWSDTFKVKLTVIDSTGKQSTVMRTVKFD